MNNNLSARHDKDIIQDIERELLIDEEISTDNVDVDVNNGKVVITGTVSTLEEKQEIEDMVNNVNGVVMVVNNINIEKI